MSLYTAVPSLAILYSTVTTDSWHERVGAASALSGPGGEATLLWLRVIGQSGKRSPGATGIQGNSGPAYRHRITALQVGSDLVRMRHAHEGQSAIGLFVASGRGTGEVRHVDGQVAGTATLDVNSFGGYWTWTDRKGAYVDLLAQGNRYRVQAASTRMPALQSAGWGYELSAEGGLPLRLSAPWHIEPQLQLRTLSARLDEASDEAGRVQFGSTDSLVGRVGLRLRYQTETMTAWTRLDLIHEFQGRSRATVSTLAGAHAADFGSSVRGRTLALTAGLAARLGRSASLYGSASHHRATGDNRGSTWRWQGGVKFDW